MRILYSVTDNNLHVKLDFEVYTRKITRKNGYICTLGYIFSYKFLILHPYMLIINYHVYITCLSIDMGPLPTRTLKYDNCRTLGMFIEGYIHVHMCIRLSLYGHT